MHLLFNIMSEILKNFYICNDISHPTPELLIKSLALSIFITNSMIKSKLLANN